MYSELTSHFARSKDKKLHRERTHETREGGVNTLGAGCSMGSPLAERLKDSSRRWMHW